MNTNGLARHYETLSPRERYPLMVAARNRGDDVEAERLARLAPTNAFIVPNFRGLAETMADLALLHVLQLLDSAAHLWRLEGLLEAQEETAEPNHAEQRLLFLVQLGGYLFQVQTEAWEQFCAELHIEADALLRDLPGYDTVQQAALSAGLWAYTAEEATAAVRQRWGADSVVPTVASVLADLRAALAAHESRWS